VQKKIRLWPSVKVFNDGSTDFYGPELITEGMEVWKLSRD
jgi:hypothetical protein